MRRLLTPANAIALIALAVALSSTAYAAIKIPANSVGAREIKNRSIRTAELTPGTLNSLRGLRATARGTGDLTVPGAGDADIPLASASFTSQSGEFLQLLVQFQRVVPPGQDCTGTDRLLRVRITVDDDPAVVAAFTTELGGSVSPLFTVALLSQEFLQLPAGKHTLFAAVSNPCDDPAEAVSLSELSLHVLSLTS